MTSDTLARLHSARPFVPFIIHMADSRKFRVNHPELLAYRPGSRMAVLLTADTVFEHIDLFLVTSITQNPGVQRGRRRSA